MKWLGAVLLGPTLWAVMFLLVYGLHGVFCAGLVGPEALGSTAQLTLVAVWAAGVLAFVPLFRILPAEDAIWTDLPRAGLWIGLGATVYTLFPVAVVTSC